MGSDSEVSGVLGWSLLLNMTGFHEDERVACRHPAGALSKGTAGFRHALSSSTCSQEGARGGFK